MKPLRRQIPSPVTLIQHKAPGQRSWHGYRHPQFRCAQE